MKHFKLLYPFPWEVLMAFEPHMMAGALNRMLAYLERYSGVAQSEWEGMTVRITWDERVAVTYLGVEFDAPKTKRNAFAARVTIG